MKRFSREYHDNRVRYILGGRIKRNPVFQIEEQESPGIINVIENPAFNKAFQQLVIKGLPVIDGDVKAALEVVQEDFSTAYMYTANIRRYGRRGIFEVYLMGMPQMLQVPVYYSQITNFLVELTGEEEIRDLDVDQVDFFYWAHVEYAVHTLLKEHGLPAMDSLGILD